MSCTSLASTGHHPPEVQTLARSRCGRTMRDGDPERDEALVISFRGGFWSVFGDENHIEGVLCQHCVRAVLGPWLMVSDGTEGDGWRPAAERKAGQPDQTG